MKKLLLILIFCYQKWVSPRKKSCCAHRAYQGGWTCSVFGRNAVAKHGAYVGTKLILRRFKYCGSAFRLIEADNSEKDNEKRRDDEPGTTCFLHGVGELACCSLFSVFG